MEFLNRFLFEVYGHKLILLRLEFLSHLTVEEESSQEVGRPLADTNDE